MSRRRILTYVLGGCFFLTATLALVTMNGWVFLASFAFQAAMFIPEWGGRK